MRGESRVRGNAIADVRVGWFAGGLVWRVVRTLAVAVIIGITGTTLPAQAFDTPTWSNASTAPFSNSDFDTGTLTFPAQGASDIRIVSPGSGRYHSHGPSVAGRVEVLLNNVWTLVYTGPFVSGSGEVSLSSLPTPLATFPAGLVSGVRLSCTTAVNQCYHSVSGGMFFSLTPTPTATTAQNTTTTFNPAAQNVPLSATVTSSFGGLVNSGTITFNVAGIGSVTSATVSGGTASASLPIPAGQGVGPYAFSATYNPGPGLTGSIGNGTLTITPAGAVVTFAPLANKVFGSGAFTVSATSTSDQPITFTAAPGGVCSISGNTVALDGVGSCTVTAHQAAGGNYAAAADVPQSFDITPASQTITFTNPGPQTYSPNGPVALTATGGPSGNPVTFTSNTLGVCSVSGSNAIILAAGTCSITADQAGNANYSAATPVTETFAINQAASLVSLSQSANPSLVGQSVTFTAIVSPTAATGSVTFKDGAATIGTGALSSGTATFSTSALAAGPHSITVEYSGDANYVSSSSTPLAHTVTPNGSVILAVSTTEGDGTFSFSSSTPALSVSVSTSGGSGQSGAISLNPGAYTVTASLPDGFGLTSITCSDGDSSGSVGTKQVTIVLASAETVTCTFSSVNSRKKTVEVISTFLSRRNDLLLSNGPDTDRQIDRLKEANGSAGSAQSDFSGSDDEKSFNGPSRLSESGTIGSPLGALKKSSYTASKTKFASSPVADFQAAMLGMGTSPRDDEREGRPGISPITVTGSNEGTTQFSFSASLSQFARYYDSVEQRKIDQLDDAMGVAGLKLPSKQATFSPFDLWVEGHYLDFSDDRTSEDSDGQFGVVYVGADYVLAPWLLVGALVQYDTLEQESREGQYKIKGHGFMAGPYATVRLSENVFLQGRAAWGTSENEVSPFLTYTDEFDTDRWLVSGTLKGDWEYGPWLFRPSASLSYIEDASEAYTDSLGVRIPGLESSLGQVKAGPEISYRTELSDGSRIEPHLSVEAIWNFESSDEVVDFGGTLEGPEEVRGRIEAGIKGQLSNGMSLDLSGTYDGIGSNSFEAIGGKVLARVPLN